MRLSAHLLLLVLSFLSLPLGACSRGGAPEIPDDERRPDLAVSPGPVDLGRADGGTDPTDTCESPCWLNPLPQGGFISGLWVDASGDGWAVGDTSLVRIRGDNPQLLRYPGWMGGPYLRAVWGSGPTDVWVAGEVVLHYDGTSWTAVSALADQGFQDVWGTGPADVWLVGSWGRIRHYDGSKWSEVPSGVMQTLRTVSGTGPNDVWVGGQFGLTLRWNGTSWRQVATPVGYDINSISCSQTNDCWAVVSSDMYGGSGKTVLHWDGVKWTQRGDIPATGSFYSVLALSANEVWLAGAPTYRFDGTSWTNTTMALSPSLIKKIGVAAGNARVGGGIYGQILRWNGSKWSPITSGRGDHMAAAWAGPAGEVWVGGRSKLLARYGNGRLEWATPPDGHGGYYGVWGSGSRDVWAVGDSGKIAHYDGTAWSDVPSGTIYTLRAVAGTGPADIWAVGDSGTLLHYDGTRFSSVVPGVSGNLRSLWVGGPTEAWLGSDTGGLSRWDGIRWTAWPTSFMREISSLWGSGSNNVWAVGGKINGTDSMILRFDGTTWTEQTPHPDMRHPYAVWGSGTGDLWTGGLYGTLFRRIGASWQPVPLGSNFRVLSMATTPRHLFVGGEYGMLIRIDLP